MAKKRKLLKKRKTLRPKKIRPVLHKKRAKIKKPKKAKKILVKRKAKRAGHFARIGKPKKVIVKKVVRVKKPVRKSQPEKQQEGFVAEALFKAKIKVVGIGGGGGSIVSEIGRSLEKATFVIADTDIRALKKRPGIKYFWFGEELTRGLGTGVNVNLAKEAAEAAKEKIAPIFKDQDIIIFIASLGGGLGSGATQVFAELARGFGGITLGIFTMPFKFEGSNKYRIAQSALKFLKKSLNVSLVIPNEKIFKIIDETTPITEAFSIINKSLIESLESLIDLIYNPGVINIDFADLRTILRGRGNSAFLNTVEAFGKNRAEDICQKVLKNPLLQNSAFEAEKILFNISGGDGLSMFEVEKISSHIANLNPKAKIIFGISRIPKLKNKVKTTILMTGGQDKEEIAVKPVESPAKAKASKPVKPKKPAVKPAPKLEPIAPPMPVLEQKKVEVVQASQAPEKKAIRRSGLEIKKAEELLEKKRLDQEKEWEIPAFLRKIKFKS